MSWLRAAACGQACRFLSTRAGQHADVGTVQGSRRWTEPLLLRRACICNVLHRNGEGVVEHDPRRVAVRKGAGVQYTPRRLLLQKTLCPHVSADRCVAAADLEGSQ